MYVWKLQYSCNVLFVCRNFSDRKPTSFKSTCGRTGNALRCFRNRLVMNLTKKESAFHRMNKVCLMNGRFPKGSFNRSVCNYICNKGKSTDFSKRIPGRTVCGNSADDFYTYASQESQYQTRQCKLGGRPEDDN